MGQLETLREVLLAQMKQVRVREGGGGREGGGRST